MGGENHLKAGALHLLKVLPILCAQKIVHAAQKNVHSNPLMIFNINDINRLVSGTRMC